MSLLYFSVVCTHRGCASHTCWVTVSSLRKSHRYLVHLGAGWDADSADTGGFTLQYIERYSPPDPCDFYCNIYSYISVI